MEAYTLIRICLMTAEAGEATYCRIRTSLFMSYIHIFPTSCSLVIVSLLNSSPRTKILSGLLPNTHPFHSYKVQNNSVRPASIHSFTAPSTFLLAPSLKIYPCDTGLIQVLFPVPTPVGAICNLSVKNTGCLIDESNIAGTEGKGGIASI